MPKYPNADIDAFLAFGGIIKRCPATFTLPSVQASSALRRDIARQHEQHRRQQRQLREAQRVYTLGELAGARDPFHLFTRG